MSLSRLMSVSFAIMCCWSNVCPMLSRLCWREYVVAVVNDVGLVIKLLLLMLRMVVELMRWCWQLRHMRW